VTPGRAKNEVIILQERCNIPIELSIESLYTDIGNHLQAASFLKRLSLTRIDVAAR
jgi:hypothetical protein